MEKIAIISDIHGNIPALEAVLADINSRGVERIFCLGDLVGKGPSGKKATQIIREHCEVVIRGNWDELMGKEDVHEVVKWHQSQLSHEEITYLTSLPFSFDFQMSGRYIRLFHASPFSVWTRIQPWDSMEKRLSMFENTNEVLGHSNEPDIVGYGDVHNAFIQHLEGKTLFNTGSVGNPLDMTQASYVLLEGVYGAEDIAPFSIQFVRVPYDIERALREAKEERLPDYEWYEQELLTGRYRGLPT
ncbi:metallophosphoesterase family protein [Bacillus kexueae]|uniref:metallophosphoesterase family protein n=1 Tax=Aeribacillus kexueae TaxID=2078952 RepID=UPI001FAF29AF|nr:metallophosphoesterase family protein [Bacillus kexueae]